MAKPFIGAAERNKEENLYDQKDQWKSKKENLKDQWNDQENEEIRDVNRVKTR